MPGYTPKMSDILTDIEQGMADAIASMTLGDGYNFDWGTVNDNDVARQEFPSAEITQTGEQCQDDEEGVWSGAYELESPFVVRVRARLSNEEVLPTYKIRKELNMALSDLKKLFGKNYHVSGACDLIMYTGSVKIPDSSGDIFRPAYMDVSFKVRYTQDRQNPDINAD